MPIPELVDYIQAQTQEGVSAQELRISLLEAGWHEADIENGFHDVAAGLHPTTPGVSIHEDLAQVRGMVAHLATRMKEFESTLASFTSLPSAASLALPVQGQIVDHHQRLSLLHRLVSFVLTLALAIGTAYIGARLVHQGSLVAQDYYVILGACGALLLIFSIISLRQGKSWGSLVASLGAITLWSGGVLVAWHTYHTLEWTVALGLGVLFLVIAIVIRRWSMRYAK